MSFCTGTVVAYLLVAAGMAWNSIDLPKGKDDTFGTAFISSAPMPTPGPLSALLPTYPEPKFQQMPVCRSAAQLRTLSMADMALLCKARWMVVEGRAYTVELSSDPQDGRWQCTVRDCTGNTANTAPARCARMSEWLGNRAAQLDQQPLRFDTIGQARTWLETAGYTLLKRLPRLIVDGREYALCRTADHQLTVLRTDHFGARNPECMAEPLIHNFGLKCASRYWAFASSEDSEGTVHWKHRPLDFTRDATGNLLLASLQSACRSTEKARGEYIAMDGGVILQLMAEAATQLPRIYAKDPRCADELIQCMVRLEFLHRNKLPAAWEAYEEWARANPGSTGWPRFSAEGDFIDIVALDGYAGTMGVQTSA